MVTVTNAWDSKPNYVDLHGQTVEVFRIGALAKALNRTTSTIRSMVLKGVLCHPLLKNGNGEWLYTRDQIEDLIALAEETGVIDPRYRRPFSSGFITQAHHILHRKPI